MRFTGSVNYRPVRIGFLVPPDDLHIISRVAQLSACLWGGRYNPIIPFFEKGGERWIEPFFENDGIEVARGYIDFFEPDVLVEAIPGMAAILGWKERETVMGLPSVVPLERFYEIDYRGRAKFAAGVDIVDVMYHLYDSEFKYERRHKRPFAVVEENDGDAYFDVVGGRYPHDEAISYIASTYKEVFDPSCLPANASTAQKFLAEGYAGPMWISRHGLEERLGRRRASDNRFYIFDSTNPGDVIDYWNFRLVEHAIPINLAWLPEHRDFMRDLITKVHRPIPGNPFGTHFRSSVQFANSITDDRLSAISREHLSDLPDMSYFASRDGHVWRNGQQAGGWRETKILATGKSISFDEQTNAEGYIKIPSPAPPFLNASGQYSTNHWINLVEPATSDTNDDVAIIYPTNIWAPGFPHLGNYGGLRIGREGWAISQHISIGYSLLRPQKGRDAIIEWFKTKGISARPSEEGQVAAQVIAAAGSLTACGMFGNRQTIVLLNEMAEGHTTRVRDGVRITTNTPDRSKHINTISQHFAKRAKGRYWNELDQFLKQSVFRAGLQVKCPTCAYHIWFALDAIGYSPTCSRCLNQFKFSETPAALHDVNWYYRVIGPFAAPDYARGGYAVALTLRSLAPRYDSEMTWSTGLALEEPNCEIDFFAWCRPSRRLSDERDEPLILIGEAKSFGRESFDPKAIASLKKVAERIPGALMVVSSLRDIAEYAEPEILRLQELATWGRRSTHRGRPCNPLIVLTATELFAQVTIYEGWKGKDGQPDELVKYPSTDPSNLYEMSELTLRRYLHIESFWDAQARAYNLPLQRSRLVGLLAARGAQ